MLGILKFFHCKQLRNEELPQLYGRVRYCLMGNGKKHIEFVSSNVGLDDMNAGKYAKFEKVGVKNRVPLLDTNTPQRAISMGTL